MDVIKLQHPFPPSLKAAAPIPYFQDGWNPHRRYFAAVEDGKILGLVCFNEQSAWLENAFGMGYTSVAEGYRNRGIASALTEALFAFAADQQRGVYVSQYEPDGKLYLRKLVLRAAEKYQVRILERDFIS
jgi:GNAT superfamily N-acetyltransferase